MNLFLGTFALLLGTSAALAPERCKGGDYPLGKFFTRLGGIIFTFVGLWTMTKVFLGKGFVSAIVSDFPPKSDMMTGVFVIVTGAIGGIGLYRSTERPNGMAQKLAVAAQWLLTLICFIFGLTVLYRSHFS